MSNPRKAGRRADRARKTRYTAAELETETFPEPRWAVPGLISEGLTLLAGAPKVGKSWLALDVALAVASGGKAFGSIDVDEGDALYLALEDTPRRLQRRLRKIKAGDALPSRLTIETSSPPLSEGGENLVRDWLDEAEEPRLVVVDVFEKVRGKRSGGDAYASDYAAMAVLKDLSDEYEVAVVVVHHTRKMTSDDWVELVAGTNGVTGAADSIAVLQRPNRDAPDGTLSITGRDIEEADTKAVALDDRMVWKISDSDPSRVGMHRTRAAILDALEAARDASEEERTYLTPAAIAKEIEGANPDNVKKTCQRMASDEQVGTDGKGGYYAFPRLVHLDECTAVDPREADPFYEYEPEEVPIEAYASP